MNTDSCQKAPVRVHGFRAAAPLKGRDPRNDVVDGPFDGIDVP
jgi:hypothetical protein